MSVITTGSNPKLLWPGLNALFGLWYDEYTPEWKPLFEHAMSYKNYEEDVSLSGFGLAPLKPEGDSIYFDATKQSYITRYQNQVFGLGFIITREEMEDNQYAQVAPARTRALAFALHQTKENLGANVFNRAFNSSYVGGDGVELCSAVHPIEGGTFPNVPTNSSGTIQGVDLSEAALEQAVIDIGNFRDNRNLRIKLLPRKLVVPQQLQFEARRILHNPERPATADRDINALYQMGSIPEGYFVNHFFVDPDAWFVTTNSPVGLRYFERSPLRFEQDNEFDTKNGKFSATERYVFGWSDPRGIWGSPGA
jgi:hypothetical protein